MKEIKLSKGEIALVDDEDYDYLVQWKWHVVYNKTSYYASTWSEGDHNNRKRLFMHRIVMNTPDELEVDHINHDTLDNRKANLRNCTHLQNKRNTIKREGKHSKYLGVEVRFLKSGLSYRVRIYVKGRAIKVGTFMNEKDAAIAYDDAVREYFGEFANTNFK